MLVILALLAALALLAPLYGADSRDGLDWAPDDILRRRRPRQHGGRDADSCDARTSDSRARSASDLASADCAARTAPGAG